MRYEVENDNVYRNEDISVKFIVSEDFNNKWVQTKNSSSTTINNEYQQELPRSAVISRIGEMAATDKTNVRAANEAFKCQLINETNYFIQLLKYSFFEDGMLNPAIEFVEERFNWNPYVTFFWIHDLYGKYADTPFVLSGLLRCVAWCVEEDMGDSVIALMIAGLVHRDTDVNEAALMVGESIRSEKVLQALSNHKLDFVPLENYRRVLIEELQEELKS